MDMTTKPHSVEAKPVDDLLPDTDAPPCTWRGRRIESWLGEPEQMIDALPAIETSPVRNGRGAANRFERFIALTWPPAGALSTPEREAWNSVPAGTCPAWPAASQPMEMARAFALLAADAGAQPGHPWRLAIAENGEWYRIDAVLQQPRPAGGRDAEPFLTIEHATHLDHLLCRAGLRCPRTRAEIPGHGHPAMVASGRLRAAGPTASALASSLAAEIEAITRALESWTRILPSTAEAASWASKHVGTHWWQASDAAFSTTGTHPSNVAAAAWRLAEASAASNDIEERTFLAEHTPAAAEQLAEAATGDPHQLTAPSPLGVH